MRARVAVQATSDSRWPRQKDFPARDLDLVTCFDVLQDLGDPLGAAAHIHRSLMPDGTGMLMEPLAGEATEDNLGPVGRVAYAFSTMAGVIVQPDITTTANRAQIIALAAKHRLPAVYPFRFLTNEGGLASYGIDVIDGYKRSATYVDRILRGEKPGDLPVQAPIKFELSVN